MSLIDRDTPKGRLVVEYDPSEVEEFTAVLYTDSEPEGRVLGREVTKIDRPDGDYTHTIGSASGTRVSILASEHAALFAELGYDPDPASPPASDPLPGS